MDIETYNKKAKYLLKRFENDYPIANKLTEEWIDKTQKAWQNIGTLYGENDKGYFGFDSNGKLNGSAGFFFITGMLIETIINSIAEYTMSSKDFKDFKEGITKEIKRTAKTTAESIFTKTIFSGEINPMICDICGTLNESNALYCKHCGEKLKR